MRQFAPEKEEAASQAGRPFGCVKTRLPFVLVKPNSYPTQPNNVTQPMPRSGKPQFREILENDQW
jgi:hypothetical protein